jgi:hypothetical protein
MAITERDIKKAILTSLMQEQAEEMTPSLLAFVLQAEGVWDQYVTFIRESNKEDELTPQLEKMLRQLAEFSFQFHHRHPYTEPCSKSHKDEKADKS